MLARLAFPTMAVGRALITFPHMARARSNPGEALVEQSQTLLQWLRELPNNGWVQPSVLPGWDVRTLADHLWQAHTGLLRALSHPTRKRGLPLTDLVRRCRCDAPTAVATTGRPWAIASRATTP